MAEIMSPPPFPIYIDHVIQDPMQPPSPSIPIDPALALYPQYYQYPQQHLPQHVLPHNYSSPSSQGSESIGTPPMDHMYANGKRSGPELASDRKKQQRKDDDSDMQSPTAEKDEVKPKPTRGSRACTVCRRLKMKCVGAEQGPPCKRCLTGNHECIFEESNRGKRSSKKHEALTRSIRKMEKQLDTVLRTIGNPALPQVSLSRSPSPTAQAQATGTRALLATSPSPPPQSTFLPSNVPANVPGSPKLHSLPDNALNPLGLLAEASLANRRAQAATNHAAAPPATSSEPKVGVASDNYFKPGPMTILPLRRLYIERQVQPEMLSFVTTEEVVALFNIFFDNIHMHCSLLDPQFHTPSLVCSRSPFLLTTICSIASKFYTAKPELHPKLTELAKRLAFSVPAKGYKSVEIVQAYLLLSLWGCGAVERYEQDKTWMLLGMAIRMATDLNLHRKTTTSIDPTTEGGRARDIEVHNRERTWILCFCLDRSFSAQMGKPSSIKEDYIIRNTKEWYTSPTACPSDMALAAYCEFQRILSRSLELLYGGTDTHSGLQLNIDYLTTIKNFESQMFAWKQTWVDMKPWEDDTQRPIEYKQMVSRFYFNYAMLVLNSFGLQNALDRAPVDTGHFFARVHSSALACALIVRDELGAKGYLKYSPDSHFVQTSYALLSLLKLIRPEFQVYLEDEQKTLKLVKDVADVLDEVAANQLHTPALYSGFLRALISAKLEPHPGSSNGAGSTAGDDAGFKEDPDSGRSAGEGSYGGSYGASGVSAGGSSGSTNQQASGSGAGASFHNYASDPLLEFQFDGEIGPQAVVDTTTFPPTLIPSGGSSEDGLGMLTMENLLSAGFWDSMLVPGYGSMDAMSGGFVFGAGGSGLITPRFGISPAGSGACTPRGTSLGSFGFGGWGTGGAITQGSINAAFEGVKHKREKSGLSGQRVIDAA